jgi:glycosyltransferase involved in cell wall biosynthesis
MRDDPAQNRDAATGERPLVTFALFAYNQEHFIREAVEGAFAQTYEPLEIVLSDDHSGDRTFEIMQEMAAAYRGPHQVRVIRNPMNMGVIPHVLARGREAKGEIVVMAAGDDISEAHRVGALVKLSLADRRALGFCSKLQIIDRQGRPVANNVDRPLNIKTTDLYFKKLGYRPVQGAAAAYRRKVFEIPEPPFREIYAEDVLLSFYIYIIGGIISRTDDSLVRYRMHDGALTNRDACKHHLDVAERQSVVSAISRESMLKSFLWMADRFGEADLVDLKRIDRDIRSCRRIIEWSNLSLNQRILSLLHEFSDLNVTNAKWQFARLLGKCPEYQPKRAISRYQKRYYNG